MTISPKDPFFISGVVKDELGWGFEWAVHDSEGLALRHVTFNGTTMVGKMSLPAIRVKYIGDHCGPFTDQITFGTLQALGWTGIQPRLVNMSKFTSGSVHWIDAGVYARIGSYHLYQAWYLSENGTILPRLWSKGLECNADHVHHPYWRLDFDVYGSAHNEALRVQQSGVYVYTYESDELKDPDSQRIWLVTNRLHGGRAWLAPDPDGSADDYSTIDVGVRRFQPHEENHPWPYNIHSYSGSGELGLDPHEVVRDTDCVLWYVSHLHHHAHEGGDAWHSCGPTIQLDTRPRQIPVRYAAVWRRSSERETQLYRSTYAQYRAKYDTLWSDEWRLKQLEIDGIDGVPRYTAVWQPSNEQETQVYRSTEKQFRATYDDLWPKGWRLKLLEIDGVDGYPRYTGVWGRSNEGEIQVYRWSLKKFRAKYDELWPAGWRLKIIKVDGVTGAPRFTGVWHKTGEHESQLYHATYGDFIAQYNELAQKGWRLRLMDVCGTRFTGVWGRSSDSQRWNGWLSFDEYKTGYDKMWQDGWRLELLNVFVGWEGEYLV